MPVLLYGVTEIADAYIELPPGVAGARVHTAECCGLTCFYSEHSMLTDSNTRETALAFHQVVNSLLERTDVIPFRFPTLLVDQSEAAEEIEKHATEYHNAFTRVRGRVQMEIQIRCSDAKQNGTSAGAANSGTDYLRARHNRHIQMKSAAAALQAAAAAMVELWREREYYDHLRCFGLIARRSVEEFRRAVAGAAIPSNLVARVSGPWPPTEFCKEE